MKTLKISIPLILILFGTFSCVVSKKKYEELAQKKSSLELDKDGLIKENEVLKSELSTTMVSLDDCNSQVEELIKDSTKLGKEFKELTSKFEYLESVSDQDARNLSLQLKKVGDLNATVESQNKLLDNQKERISSLNADLLERNNRLADLQKTFDKSKRDIERLENDLKKGHENETKLQSDLRAREQRVQELEQLIAQKDASVKSMKEKISKALLGFDKDELSVNVEDGKIYVSLEEQLLFSSGQYKIDTKGQEALSKLAGALANNSDDFSVMVEGHTDDVPYHGSGVIKDNWDLSVLRSTSIVRVLVKNKLDPKKVIASGRGEYLPKVVGDSKEARAKNRRIEIIIIPNIDELLQMLDE